MSSAPNIAAPPAEPPTVAFFFSDAETGEPLDQEALVAVFAAAVELTFRNVNTGEVIEVFDPAELRMRPPGSNPAGPITFELTFRNAWWDAAGRLHRYRPPTSPQPRLARTATRPRGRRGSRRRASRAPPSGDPEPEPPPGPDGWAA
jgi:hypothetical protein